MARLARWGTCRPDAARVVEPFQVALLSPHLNAGMHALYFREVHMQDLSHWYRVEPFQVGPLSTH